MANAVPFEPKNVMPIDIEAIEERAKPLVHFTVEKWVMNAKVEANADILRETGEHEDFVWQHLRKEMGLES
jgi:hypothetical protein